MTRKPCDDAFDREEKAFRKAADKLRGAAATCVRQAGSDLARACRIFREDDIVQLGAFITENIRFPYNFDNVRAACHLYTSAHRGSLKLSSQRRADPMDLITVAALNLEDACQFMLSEDASDLLSVGSATVSSRAASEEILTVLSHLV